MTGKGERPVRRERDTLGEMEVPSDALYGAQTARAVDNFRISGWLVPLRLVRSIAAIKRAMAVANGERGRLRPEVAAAIAAAAGDVVNGLHADQFPVEVFQTGSGTSTNMNVNEVVAHLANVRLGGDPSAHTPVHPNDHVNLGQSSNDVVPSAVRIAALLAWRDDARPAAEGVAQELARLATVHAETVTLGRTHFMDAVPTTYGRVFDAWARRVAEATARVDSAGRRLLDLPLGGTALGTGLGADHRAVTRAVERLAAELDLALCVQANPAVGIGSQETVIVHADALAGLARTLGAIAGDIRLRSSGPFGGFGELRLPAVQPGSSIMPGKVNPVIPEAMAQVAIQVEGLAAACRGAAALHQLDLSHANPMLAWNVETMTALLAGSCRTLVEKCLSGLEIDVERCRQLAEASPALATALAGRIGYERAAEVAKAAEKSGETVLQTARRLQVLPESELEELLDVRRIAGGG